MRCHKIPKVTGKSWSKGLNVQSWSTFSVDQYMSGNFVLQIKEKLRTLTKESIKHHGIYRTWALRELGSYLKQLTTNHPDGNCLKVDANSFFLAQRLTCSPASRCTCFSVLHVENLRVAVTLWDQQCAPRGLARAAQCILTALKNWARCSHERLF